MDTTQTITHVSHCYGYGGIDLGLKRVFGDRLRTIAACEIEAFALWNGLAKSEAGQADVDVPFWTNIKTFPFAEFHGLVDIYSAGFPCQPFSTAGKRGSTEDPRHLYPFIAAGISVMQPNVVFLENVEGIVSAKCADGTSVLLYVLRDLESRGYRPTWGLFSASEVGAPHQRKRVFILAHHHHPRSQGWDSTILQECSDQWPARPGDSQLSWEPPRTVADTASRRRSERWSGSGAEIQGNGTERSGEYTRSECIGELPRRFEGLGSTAHTERSDQTRREPASGETGERRAHDQFGGSSSHTRQTEPAMGRGTDGNPYRVDYAELCDSRVDELRLLGNGVVPATVERAFRALTKRLCE